MADEASRSCAEGFKWSKTITIFLIGEIKKNYERLKGGVKKIIYQEIAISINSAFGTNLTHEQVDSKWKGLKKTYKKIKDQNNTTGQARKVWEYYENLDEILFKAPEVNPPATLSSEESEPQIFQPVVEVTTQQDDVEIVKICSPFSTNLRKRRKKHNNNDDPAEKRHRERMEATNRFLNLFQQMVDKM